MFRSYLLIAAISFPLLLSGCDDTALPSDPRTEPSPRPSASASATAVEQVRFQLRQIRATAFWFIQIGPCLETFVSVFGSERALKEQPGKPTTGPLAFVQVSDFDPCTGQSLRDLVGATSDVVVQANSRLTEARLRATATAVDNISGAEVQVEVDLAWTGTGDLVSESTRERTKTPGRMFSAWVKGVFREAVASGTVVVGGENLTTATSDGGDIARIRSGFFEIVRATPEPPDTLS